MNYFSKNRLGWILLGIFLIFFHFTLTEAKAHSCLNVLGFGNDIVLMPLILLSAILVVMCRIFMNQRFDVEIADRMNTPLAYGGLRQYDTWGEAPPEAGGSKDGLDKIRGMDSSFNEQRFKDTVLENYVQIQGAWVNRDMSGVHGLLTEDIYVAIQQDTEAFRAEKRINKREGINVRNVEMIETWQEDGRTFITVRFNADLLDYTVDESTGDIVSGNRTVPVKLTEYWTFVQTGVDMTWRLSAINSGFHITRDYPQSSCRQDPR